MSKRKQKMLLKNASRFGWVETMKEDEFVLRMGAGNKNRNIIKTRTENLSHEDFVEVTESNEVKIISKSRINELLPNLKTGLFMRLRSQFIRACRDYFYKYDYTEIFPPLTVGNNLPTGDNALMVESRVELSQSSQKYLEYAVPCVGNCFSITSSFRDEKIITNRHLTEFLHLEVEWLNVQTLEEHISKIKHFIQNVIENFILLAKDEIKDFGLDLSNIDLSCPIIPYYKWDGNVSQMTIITNIPLAKYSFDLVPNHNCDVMVPVMGEIIGSGIRTWDLDELLYRINKCGLNPINYSNYINLRLLGHGRTAGFGLGVDRLLSWLLQQSDIKNVISFPRYPNQKTFD